MIDVCNLQRHKGADHGHKIHVTGLRSVRFCAGYRERVTLILICFLLSMSVPQAVVKVTINKKVKVITRLQSVAFRS